jgi:hypothetical protein
MVVASPFESTSAMRRWYERIRTAELPRNRNQHKDTPLFAALGWNKPLLVATAASWNPFGTTHFAWIDLCLAHVVPRTDFVSLVDFSITDPRMHFHALRSPTGIVDRPDYYHQHWGLIAGGFWCGGLKSCGEFARAFADEAEAVLSTGRAALEMEIFARLVAREPQQYALSYGDYQDLLSNYWMPVTNFTHLRWMIDDARDRDPGFAEILQETMRLRVQC